MIIYFIGTNYTSSSIHYKLTDRCFSAKILKFTITNTIVSALVEIMPGLG